MKNDKKKVCLITRHAIVNYGSFLQSFATQEILEEMNMDVIILNYIRSDENYKNVTKLLLSKSKKWNKNFITKLIYTSIQWPDHFIAGKVFEKHRRKWLNLSEEFEVLNNNTQNIPNADFYCTGSDQVWGEIGSDDFDAAYFLEFKKPQNSKSLAIAASFGKSNYSDKRIEHYKDLLKKYSKITVREKTAIEIVELAHQKANIILDPTLIYGREKWLKLIPKIKEQKYVLLYQLNTNSEMDSYAVEFAKKVNLPLLRISMEIHNKGKKGKFKWCLSPFEFLAYVNQATYMITDSFHGTAFAIMFNTQFIEILPAEKRTRNRNILQQFGLEDRILSQNNDFSYIDNNIDYEKVNEKVKTAREESQRTLIELFND